MSNNVECPQCLGVGEEFQRGTGKKTCALCKGKGEVHPHLAEDFILSLNELEGNDDEIYIN